MLSPNLQERFSDSSLHVHLGEGPRAFLPNRSLYTPSARTTSRIADLFSDIGFRHLYSSEDGPHHFVCPRTIGCDPRFALDYHHFPHVKAGVTDYFDLTYSNGHVRDGHLRLSVSHEGLVTLARFKDHQPQDLFISPNVNLVFDRLGSEMPAPFAEAIARAPIERLRRLGHRHADDLSRWHEAHLSQG